MRRSLLYALAGVLFMPPTAHSQSSALQRAGVITEGPVTTPGPAELPRLAHLPG